MKKLSVVVITRNEEQNLPRCLGSVSWADEFVVIDSGSSDRTQTVAESLGARFYSFGWHGYGPAKQEGVRRAEGEWVLSIDADEEVGPELATEIRAVVDGGGEFDGYYLPRQTRFLGRWMRHGGWYPDYVLRLFRRDRGGFDDAKVHESVVLNGPTARLKHDLRHHCYPTLESYFEKFNRYTTLAAEDLHRQGRTAGVIKIIVNPIAKFIKQYVLRAGFLDGVEGFVLAVLSSGYVMTKYTKLRELNRRAGSGE